MTKPERFKTIYREGKAEFTEKKSRFVGQAFPVYFRRRSESMFAG